MSTDDLIDTIENRIFSEIEVGDSSTLARTLRPEDIQMFAIISGDMNPTHVDPEYARSSQFREVVGHGMWGGMIFSNIIGTQFPGPGTVYVDQNLNFDRPVRVGDTLTVDRHLSAQVRTQPPHPVRLQLHQPGWRTGHPWHGRGGRADREDQAREGHAAGNKVIDNEVGALRPPARDHPGSLPGPDGSHPSLRHRIAAREPCWRATAA